MKTALKAIALALSCLCLSFGKVNAQCTVSNPVLSNISYVQGATCTITFDIEFDLTSNGGNKYVGMYVYSGTLPSTFYGTGSDVPTTATINAASNVLATLQINTDVSTTITSASYSAKNSSGNPTSFKASRPFTKTATGATGQNRFKISGVTVTVPNCTGGPVDLKLDVGSTNASSFNNYMCLVAGLPFRANDPVLNGQIQCAAPRSFTFSVNTSTATTVTFSAYSDAARTTLLTAPAGFTYSGTGVSSPTAITSYSNITLNVPANSNLSFGTFRYAAANGTANPVYLSLSLASNSLNTNSLQIDNGCAALPVVYESFTASRNQNNVLLQWETATEQSNTGFYVERKSGSSAWTSLAFVPKKAGSGKQFYQYNDAIVDKGIIQYRLRQVDADGNAKYSDIKTVKGLEQTAEVSLFPNPAAGGRFSVVFSDNDAYNVQVIDAVGRTVKQLNGAKNSISIAGLKPGAYMVMTENSQSAARTTQKIIVQ